MAKYANSRRINDLSIFRSASNGIKKFAAQHRKDRGKKKSEWVSVLHSKLVNA